MMGIPVEILYTEGCGRWQAARDAVYREADSLGMAVQMSETLVIDQAMAERLRFPGSPTVRVRGRDVQSEVEPHADFGLG